MSRNSRFYTSMIHSTAWIVAKETLNWFFPTVSRDSALYTTMGDSGRANKMHSIIAISLFGTWFAPSFKHKGILEILVSVTYNYVTICLKRNPPRLNKTSICARGTGTDVLYADLVCNKQTNNHYGWTKKVAWGVSLRKLTSTSWHFWSYTYPVEGLPACPGFLLACF